MLGLRGKIQVVSNRLNGFDVEQLDNLYSLPSIVKVIISTRLRRVANVCTRQVRTDCYYLAH